MELIQFFVYANTPLSVPSICSIFSGRSNGSGVGSPSL
ncbi:hypothetical protein P647_3422, partial [Acinetobacter baumannii UH12208]